MRKQIIGLSDAKRIRSAKSSDMNFTKFVNTGDSLRFYFKVVNVNDDPEGEPIWSIPIGSEEFYTLNADGRSQSVKVDEKVNLRDYIKVAKLLHTADYYNEVKKAQESALAAGLANASVEAKLKQIRTRFYGDFDDKNNIVFPEISPILENARDIQKVQCIVAKTKLVGDEGRVALMDGTTPAVCQINLSKTKIDDLIAALRVEANFKPDEFHEVPGCDPQNPEYWIEISGDYRGNSKMEAGRNMKFVGVNKITTTKMTNPELFASVIAPEFSRLFVKSEDIINKSAESRYAINAATLIPKVLTAFSTSIANVNEIPMDANEMKYYGKAALDLGIFKDNEVALNHVTKAVELYGNEEDKEELEKKEAEENKASDSLTNSVDITDDSIDGLDII